MGNYTMLALKYGIFDICRITRCVPKRTYAWSLNKPFWDSYTRNSSKLSAKNFRGHKSLCHGLVKTQYGQRMVYPLLCRTFSKSLRKLKSKTYSGDSEEEEDGQDDVIDDSEVEELFQQHIPSGIGDGDHRIFIVHPDVKWGKKKQYLTTGKKSKQQTATVVKNSTESLETILLAC